MSGIKKTLLRSLQAVLLLAIVVGCPLAVWKGWPLWGEWYKNRLAQEIFAEISTADDACAIMLVRQLGELGPPAYDELMSAAVAPRTSVATTARNELALKLAAHRLRMVREPDLAEAQALVTLSRVLAKHAAEFGPNGAYWAEGLALKLIDLADLMQASETSEILEATSRVLATIPPQGPRLKTVQADAPPLVDPEPVRLEPPEIDLDLLNVPSETTLAKDGQALIVDAVSPTVEPHAIEETPKPEPSPKPIDRVVDSEVQRMPWVTFGQSSMSVQVQPPPVTPNSSGFQSVPTPLQMEQRLQALRKRSTKLLVQKLPYADKFMAGTIRMVLLERGMDEQEIELARRMADADVTVRAQLIEQISELPAVSARRLLRMMLRDTNADIRLQALTTLATTGDPQLAQLAREIATRDEDRRVADLAAELMRR